MTLEREAHSTGRNAVTPAAGHRQTATLAPVPEKERAESAPPAATQPPGVRTPTGDSALQPGQGGGASRSDAALSPAPSPAPAPLDPRLAAAAKDADDFWNDTGPDKVDSPTQKEPEPDGFIRRYYLTDEMYDAIDMPEGRNQFLKHFDVDMPKEMVRAEDSSQGGYLRFYYSDFLDSKQHRNACERLRDAWRDRQKDSKRLFEWICSLKPRSKLEAYPMFVIVQEMLKEILDNKLELHLEMLNEARERIDLLDGDTSELRDQCGRMEEDLVKSQEKISQMQQAIDEGLEREEQLKNEINVLQEELKTHSEEIENREEEKNRIQKMYNRSLDNVEFERLVNSVTRFRVNSIEADMAMRVEDLRNWKQHAEAAAKALDGRSYVPPADLKQSVDARAAEAGMECLCYLETELQATLYRRTMDLDGVGMLDNELQTFLQLSCELTSSVLQTPNVYISEIIEDSSKHLLASSTGEAPEKRFMFTAVTGANNFLMGDSLPTHTTTYRHFTGDQFRKPLLMNVKERWNELHLFKKDDVAKPSTSTTMYIAVPFFDLQGQIRGYVAADNLRMRPDQVKDLSAEWSVHFMERIAKILGKAWKLSKATLDDYVENEGPRYYAKSIIECLAGKTEVDMYNPDYAPPDFINAFPFMLEFALRGSNMFVDFDVELPRKTFFGTKEEAELQIVKVQRLKQLRKSLQDQIFEDTERKKETKLLVFSHKTPPAETIKVWRAALVMLGIHDDGVLDPDPKHAWQKISVLLDEDNKEKSSSQKISNIVRDFDPVNPKTLGNKKMEARFTLAAGLTKNIKSSLLIREGPVQMLLLQWIVLCLWTHHLVRSQGLKDAISLLNRVQEL